MWLVIKAIFFTVVTVTFFLMLPVIGFLLGIGTVFYIVYEIIKDYDRIKKKGD